MLSFDRQLCDHAQNADDILFVNRAVAVDVGVLFALCADIGGAVLCDESREQDGIRNIGGFFAVDIAAGVDCGFLIRMREPFIKSGDCGYFAFACRGGQLEFQCQRLDFRAFKFSVLVIGAERDKEMCAGPVPCT